VRFEKLHDWDTGRNFLGFEEGCLVALVRNQLGPRTVVPLSALAISLVLCVWLQGLYTSPTVLTRRGFDPGGCRVTQEDC
jgi:hypothetical protein